MDAGDDGSDFAATAFSSPEVLLRTVLSLSPFGILTALLFLTIAYVPAAILIAHLSERRSGLSTRIYNDFAPLYACTLLAWTAAALPSVAIRAVAPALALPVLAASYVYFSILMVFGFRAVFGTGFGKAILIASTAWLAAAGGLLGYQVIGALISLLASPFFLFYGYRFFQGDLQALGGGLRSRQAFRRHLESATINPNDAEAHYQLGLIYMQRRRVSEAKERFERAAQIDKTEAGPHHQLGLIARDSGQNDVALRHFEIAAKLEPGHSSHEVIRELGAACKAMGRLAEARTALDKYVARRPYDPEGLFHLAETLAALGDAEGAKENYKACVEAVRTAPHFRKAMLKPWLRAAEAGLRNLAARSKAAG